MNYDARTLWVLSGLPVEEFDLAVMCEAAKRGNPDALRKYFDSDKAGIDWGSDGDFMRCVEKASAHMTDEQAKGFCNLRHKEATGMSTAGHKKALKA